MGTQNPYDFETFYHAVCADLQTKGEVHSMSKQFSLLGDDNERIKFVLEKNFAGSVHWKDFNFSPKDRSESQKLRNLGNQVYQKNSATFLACLPSSYQSKSQLYCGPNGPTASIFYGI